MGIKCFLPCFWLLWKVIEIEYIWVWIADSFVSILLVLFDNIH